MKEISDAGRIQSYISQYNMDRIFLEMPKMQLFSYAKDEVMNHTLNPDDYLLFLVKGSVHLSNIRKDGSRYQINHIRPFTCFGDMEFNQNGAKQFEIIADQHCEVLCIHRAVYEEQLKKDYLFLNFLVTSLTEKMSLISSTYAENGTLEKRVLFYIRRHHGILMHVEETADELGCSRRQLQRILKKLCDEKRIIKEKKGRYIQVTK